MDFLPLRDAVPSHLPIPDPGGVDYDNKGFLGYDKRQGWDSDALRRGAVRDSRTDFHGYTTSVMESIPADSMPKDARGLVQALVGLYTILDPLRDVARGTRQTDFSRRSLLRNPAG